MMYDSQRISKKAKKKMQVRNFYWSDVKITKMEPFYPRGFKIQIWQEQG